MCFAFAFDVDEDVIEVYYHKNVEILCQDLVDVALKRDWYVSQSKMYDLILEVAMVRPEGCLPFITFSDPHLMVGIGQIQLGETLSLTQSIQWFSVQRQGIPILDSQIVETLVIYA